MYNYNHETIVEADAESTFAWFEHEGSFRRLMPPWEVAEEVRADESLEVGSQRVFRFPMGPIKMTWVAEHTGYDPPHFFADKLVSRDYTYCLIPILNLNSMQRYINKIGRAHV